MFRRPSGEAQEIPLREKVKVWRSKNIEKVRMKTTAHFCPNPEIRGMRRWLPRRPKRRHRKRPAESRRVMQSVSGLEVGVAGCEKEPACLKNTACGINRAIPPPIRRRNPQS
jgi:hypothetical protein